MGIAIVWIMLFHLPFHPNIPIIKQIMFLGYGGVDIFLFLSGFGLYYSLSRKNVVLSQYYKKRFIRIFPEFWFCLLVIFLLHRNFDFHSICSLLYRATTIGYWIPNTPFTLWYISCIVLFYAIFPFYFKLFSKFGLNVSLWFIVSGLLLTIIYGLVMVLFFDNENKGHLLILTISRIPIFFIGAVVGYFTKEKMFRKYRSMNMIILIFLLLSIVAIITLPYLWKNYQAYFWTCSLFFIPFIFITPSLCIIIVSIIDKMPNIISNIFTKAGSISLELYIVHEHLYSKLIPKLSTNIGIYTSEIIALLLSLCIAIILYYINRFVLQNMCRRILNF